MECETIINLSINVASFVLGGFCWWFFDRKVLKQNIKLNAHQLEKIAAEKEENKKALVRIKLTRAEGHKKKLIVSNTGKSPARNIRIEGLYENGIRFLNDVTPSDIELLEPENPKNYMVVLSRMVNHSPSKITLFWEDDFDKKNEFCDYLNEE